MHAVVNPAITHLNLKGAFNTPRIVPRVHTEPVVKSFLNSPPNHFDSVATVCRTSLVVINTARISQEIFIDGEGASDRAISHYFFLDEFAAFNRVGGDTSYFFVGVDEVVIGLASVFTDGFDCVGLFARGEAFDVDVVRALSHCVVVAEFFIAVVTA